MRGRSGGEGAEPGAAAEVPGFGFDRYEGCPGTSRGSHVGNCCRDRLGRRRLGGGAVREDGQGTGREQRDAAETGDDSSPHGQLLQGIGDLWGLRAPGAGGWWPGLSVAGPVTRSAGSEPWD
ncbi:hypothetical protein Sm713_28490 [Streptomyces sp. TS71-3]|nr:hypothetical protein Sm713_28490 [Streptomyces sp. TS71-3]